MQCVCVCVYIYMCMCIASVSDLNFLDVNLREVLCAPAETYRPFVRYF